MEAKVSGQGAPKVRLAKWEATLFRFLFVIASWTLVIGTTSPDWWDYSFSSWLEQGRLTKADDWLWYAPKHQHESEIRMPRGKFHSISTSSALNVDITIYLGGAGGGCPQKSWRGPFAIRYEQIRITEGNDWIRNWTWRVPWRSSRRSKPSGSRGILGIKISKIKSHLKIN